MKNLDIVVYSSIFVVNCLKGTNFDSVTIFSLKQCLVINSISTWWSYCKGV